MQNYIDTDIHEGHTDDAKTATIAGHHVSLASAHNLDPESEDFSPARVGSYKLDITPNPSFNDKVEAYGGDDSHFHDPIHLSELKKEVAKRYKMDAGKMTATMVAASDGLQKGLGIHLHGSNENNDLGFIQALESAMLTDNPAETLVKQAVSSGKSGDNTTAAIIPLDKTSKQPIAVVIADGYQTGGGKVAQEVVNSFELTLMRTNTPSSEVSNPDAAKHKASDPNLGKKTNQNL